MLLTIDIGNTVVSFGVLKAGKLVKFYGVATRLSRRELKSKLEKVLKEIDDDFTSLKDVVVCSVVPRVSKMIKPLIEDQFDLKPIVIGEDVAVPLKNLYRNPKQVGQDRLVGAYAAKEFYGVPAIIIDLGTAITLDVISKKGEYLGGAIVPGIRLTAEALFKKTAMLPKIKIKGPRQVIGKTTQESILSGIFYGYGFLCRGMIKQMTSQLKEKPKIVVTGGHALLMKKYIGNDIQQIDTELVFKGMALVQEYYL